MARPPVVTMPATTAPRINRWKESEAQSLWRAASMPAPDDETKAEKTGMPHEIEDPSTDS